MELHTARSASIPAAKPTITTEAASTNHAHQLRAWKDPHFTHRDLRELNSLARSLGEMAEQVGRSSMNGTAENMEQTLALLITGASRLRAAAENLRERSNAGTAREGLFWEYFDVADMLQVLMVSARVLVGVKPVKVEMVSGEGPLCMWSDSDKVMQIVSNLLGNAARYTDRGRITLILGKQQDHLTIMVTDTGKGMREADIKLITSRMNNCAGRNIPTLKGGLMRTHSLVELLGGNISLASRLHEGTIAEVRLPLGHTCVKQAAGRELTARSSV